MGFNSSMMTDLEEEQRQKDLKFVESELEKAQKHFDKAYDEWQLSGGYGTRTTYNRWANHIRLCKLALKAVNYQCPACHRHYETVRRKMKELESLEKEGKENISIEDAKRIIADIW